MDCMLFESHGEFAKDYIDAAVQSIRNGNSTDAAQCLVWAIEKLNAMQKENELC